jgi:hypothetical protein
MTLAQIRARLRKAHIPSVAKATGIPLRTLYRVAATEVVPTYGHVMALERWAKK